MKTDTVVRTGVENKRMKYYRQLLCRREFQSYAPLRPGHARARVCVCSICLRRLGFVTAIQLTWACGLAAGFLGFYPSTHLPTHKRMDS